MKFIFDFLKKIFPVTSMFAGGIIPVTLTVKALTSSIPANETNKSLTIRADKKPNLPEKTINPESAPKLEKPSKENNGEGKDNGKASGDSGEEGKSDSPTTNGKESKSQEGTSTDENSDGKSQPESSTTQSNPGPTQDSQREKSPPKRKPAKPSKQIQKYLKKLKSSSSNTDNTNALALEIVKKLQESLQNLVSS